MAVSWPLWAVDGILEHSTNPHTPLAWQRIPSDFYRSDGLSHYYGLSTSEQSQFYRLRRGGSTVAGLVDHWGMDEGSGELAADRVGSGQSLQLSNVTWSLGRMGGGSLRFNGLEHHSGGSLAWVTNVNYQVLPSNGLPFSISFWLNPDALSGGRHALLGNGSPGSNGWSLTLYNAGPGTNYLILAGMGGESSLSLTGRTLLLPGRWRQLTLTYASNQAAIYMDSCLLAQGAGRLINTQNPVCFGGTMESYPGFQGRLDELRIYRKVLGEEEVAVKGYWRFDEDAGTLAADSSIQGNPAAVMSSPAWSPGKSGTGVDLSQGPVAIANDDYLVLPPSGEAFSLSLWLLPRDLPPGRSSLLSCSDGLSGGWELTVESDDLSRTWLDFTSTNLGGTLALRAPMSLTNGVWTKLDLTYSGGIATVYLNGSMSRTEAGAIRSVHAPLIVGGARGAASFKGVVDELKIYGRERNASEIGPVALPMWEFALQNSSTNLVLQGSGPAGKPLMFSLLSSPSPTLGAISHSPGSPIIAYTAGDQKGPDAFAYTVSDGEFTSPPATAVVSVVKPHWLSLNGGPLHPNDGSSPEQAWVAGSAKALDEIWRTNNYYDCFFYSAGEFETTGWKFMQRSTANPGCKHIGNDMNGPDATVIRLVDAWAAWDEGLIFGSLHQNAYCDGFEVRNLVLDCNAEGNPKYARGEPVWLKIPLTATSRVDSVTMRWADAPTVGNYFKIGRPAEFALCNRTPAQAGSFTNCTTYVSSGQVDVVTGSAETDEILLRLERRADGVDFYGLAELEVSGATVSLPTATSPDGVESVLDAEHSILLAFDGDQDTAWASGTENQVQITLPLAPDTPVSQINLHWDCRTLPDLKRLGPAVGYMVYARDSVSDQLREIEFFSHGWDSNGWEIVTFGTAQSTNSITTDQLTLLLLIPQTGVDYYSIREATLQNGQARTPMRVPTAMNTLPGHGPHSILLAFDGEMSTAWASGTQGSVAAAEVRGSNLRFSNLKVIGFGTKGARECFPLFMLAPALSATRPAPMRNVLVENCIFQDPAATNPDGVTVVAIVGQGSGSLINAIVRGCTVTGVGSHFAYSHAFGANHIENCVVEDCGFATYFEPDPALGTSSIGPVLIRSNLFLNVSFGVSVDSHPGGRFDALTCIGNEMVLRGSGTAGYGLRICDVCGIGPTSSITNLTVLNNVVRYPNWEVRPGALDGGLMYGDIRHAVYANNIVALGTSSPLRVRSYPAGLIPDVPEPEDCDHPRLVVPGPSAIPPSLDLLPPGYRRAWYNNRDLSGLLLPVRFLHSGVDRNASQQQWPE